MIIVLDGGPLGLVSNPKATEAGWECREWMRALVALPTADSKALDCDVILAAQALVVNGIVATENVDHLSRLVRAKHWRDISVALGPG